MSFKDRYADFCERLGIGVPILKLHRRCRTGPLAVASFIIQC